MRVSSPPFSIFLLESDFPQAPQAQRYMIDSRYHFSHSPAVSPKFISKHLTGSIASYLTEILKEKSVHFSMETLTGFQSQCILLIIISWFHVCAWKIHSDVEGNGEKPHHCSSGRRSFRMWWVNIANLITNSGTAEVAYLVSLCMFLWAYVSDVGIYTMECGIYAKFPGKCMQYQQ